MGNEVQYYAVDNTLPLVPPNGEVNGSIKLVTADGSAVFPAAGIPTLPTANGDYTLRVASGVYSWVLEGT
jgi:hypothetical protein